MNDSQIEYRPMGFDGRSATLMRASLPWPFDVREQICSKPVSEVDLSQPHLEHHDICVCSVMLCLIVAFITRGTYSIAPISRDDELRWLLPITMSRS